MHDCARFTKQSNLLQSVAICCNDICTVIICGLAVCPELVAESRALAVLDCDHRVVSSLASLASLAGEVLCPGGHV